MAFYHFLLSVVASMILLRLILRRENTNRCEGDRKVILKIKNNIAFDSQSLYFGGSETSDEVWDSKRRAETLGI